ncbi:ZIP family metal transporter [Sporosarcina sp. OR05]|uniref:ZIP family metal transporter n=1 Tax=Sporosarcina sp. OR05 TaxID=2969819 RepID=UPI003529E324
MWVVSFIATCIGLGVGGGMAAVMNRYTRSIGTIYAVCAGLLLGLLSLEIAPEAIRLGGWTVFAIGFVVGVIVYKITHKWLHKQTLIRNDPQKNQWIRSGLFLTIIIMLHNFPMGVVLGASPHDDFSVAFLQAMILHTIPEGMILFTPLLLAGVRSTVLFLLSVLLSIPVGVGAFIGDGIGLQYHLLWALFISVTVGMIYMIAMKEILTESVKRSSNTYSLFVACIAFGLFGLYVLLV